MGKLYSKIRVFLWIVLCCGWFAGCQQRISEADYQVIPLPKHIDLNKDTPFAMTKNTIIYYDEGDTLRREAEFLAEPGTT